MTIFGNLSWLIAWLMSNPV